MKNSFSSPTPGDYNFNQVTYGSTSLKALYRLHSLLFVFMLAIFPLVSMAQLVTVHDPIAQVTITGDQVRAMGELSHQATGKPVVLDFEGLFNLDEILQFYSGGTSRDGYSGRTAGISFREGALAIIDSKNGGSGNFSKKVLPNTVMFFPVGEKIVINIERGFSDAFSFFFSTLEPGVVKIYSDTDEKGELLATKQYLQNVTGGTENISYDQWQVFKVSFNGTAKSVAITGKANQCAFDDLTFGVAELSGAGIADVSTTEKSGSGSVFTTPADPTEKGKYFVSGASRFGVSAGSQKSKSDGSTSDESKSSVFNLEFLPKAGYFFLDNLVGGLFIDLEIDNSKSKSSSGNSSKSTYFAIGPFARYYVPVTEKLLPFAEAQVGFGVNNSSYKFSFISTEWIKTKQSVFTYRLGAGATYFINKIVGLDLFMGYLHDAYKYKDSEDSDDSRSTEASGSKSVYGEFTFQAGIVIVLHCGK